MLLRFSLYMSKCDLFPSFDSRGSGVGVCVVSVTTGRWGWWVGVVSMTVGEVGLVGVRGFHD